MENEKSGELFTTTSKQFPKKRISSTGGGNSY